MIKKRTTEANWIASVCDPSMACMPTTRLSKYGETRKLEDAGIDSEGAIAEYGERVTLFQVRPISIDWVHLIEQKNIFGYKAIFKRCVIQIKNLDDIAITRDENGDITDEVIDLFPMEIVQDIAMYVIQQRNKSASAPFSLPAGWSVEAIRRREAYARSVSTRNANTALSPGE